jgi:hypothetical protein
VLELHVAELVAPEHGEKLGPPAVFPSGVPKSAKRTLEIFWPDGHVAVAVPCSEVVPEALVS